MAPGILLQARELLEGAFSQRFCGLVLYGSQARGDAGHNSDIDLLVLLRGPVEFGKDLERVIHALYPLQLEVDQALHALPVDVEAYNTEAANVYHMAHVEGVRL